ncbi:hypothetical protein X751_30060 [Mesorhizobium sp. LNJC395A00]|nr:hypothetical protein X751_30060 [Mesorhizobium sp. LNJC395A00]
MKLDRFYLNFDVPAGLTGWRRSALSAAAPDKGYGRERKQTEIRRANDACAVHGCQVSVNDYWRTAIEEGCDSSILVKRIWLPPMLTPD